MYVILYVTISSCSTFVRSTNTISNTTLLLRQLFHRYDTLGPLSLSLPPIPLAPGPAHWKPSAFLCQTQLPFPAPASTLPQHGLHSLLHIHLPLWTIHSHFALSLCTLSLTIPWPLGNKERLGVQRIRRKNQRLLPLQQHPLHQST